MEKVAEQHILTKCSKCNTFQVINDLVLSKNLKVAITQLCNEPQKFNRTARGQQVHHKSAETDPMGAT